MYVRVNEVVLNLTDDDFEKDEKSKSINLTEDGTEHVERLLEAAGLLQGKNLYDIENTQVEQHVNQALKEIPMLRTDSYSTGTYGQDVMIAELKGTMVKSRTNGWREKEV